MKKLFLLYFLMFQTFVYGQWEGVQGPFFHTIVQMLHGFPDSDLVLFSGHGTQIDQKTGEGPQGWMLSQLNNDDIVNIALFNQFIYGVIVYQNDTIIYGTFLHLNNDPLLRSAKFSNGSFSPFASFNSAVRNMKIINNELYAFGGFTEVEGIQVTGIIKFDGENWQTVGPNIDADFFTINDAEIFQDELYVGGNLSTTGGIDDLLVLRNNEWQVVGELFNGSMAHINRMCIFQDELVVAGMFRQSDGFIGHCIQKWNGTSWAEVGNSVQGTNFSNTSFNQIWEMKIQGDYLYVSGDFKYANYTPMKNLARWDGQQWCGFYTENLQTTLHRFTFSNGKLLIASNQPIGEENSKIYTYVLDNEVFPCSPPVTSTEDIDNVISPFSIHPNPSSQTVYLNSPDITPGSFVRIYNLSGQMVYEQNVLEQSERITIATANIGQPGMYVVQLHNPGKAMAVQKLVVVE
jgi:hypothetical protein